MTMARSYSRIFPLLLARNGICHPGRSSMKYNNFCSVTPNIPVKIPVYGILRIHSHQALKIFPIPPQKSMALNEAYFTNCSGKEICSTCEKIKEFRVEIPPASSSSKFQEEHHSESLLLQDNTRLEVPLNYDMSGVLETSSADLMLGRFENDFIDFESKGGKLICQNQIACKTFRWHSIQGDGDVFIKGGIHGNVDIQVTGKGTIDAGKVQGDQHELRSDRGDIKVEALYSVGASLFTRTGTMELRNIHGEIQVDLGSEGNLNLRGLDGSLSVKGATGKVSLAVDRLQADSSIEMTGSSEISIQVNPEGFNSDVIVEGAAEVYIDEELGATFQESGEGEGRIEMSNDTSGQPFQLKIVTAGGRVAIKKLDWLSSFTGIDFIGTSQR
ncbi:unnamed protein product [Cyprideis torosa]|uniref:Uncharacterized protein n=1 Tax=Cyprideis torosa TaxID=163714 RepID=A0A7R8WFF3_9CRUS|nr:unnamed protein product [Cyprideis torosa]CAG0890859.1 unnamed protein product [Cyprideis torosa]